MKVMGSLPRSTIGAIACNVALIHAAGLVLLSQSQPGINRGGAGTTPRAKVVQMRLASAKPAASPALAATALPVSPPDGTTDSSTVVTSDMSPEAPPSRPFVVDDVLSDLSVDASPQARSSGSEYIPRPQLSAAPRPSAPVIVPFPKEVTSAGRYTAILALFIDETGVVRRVRIDGPALPKAMEDAARDSFLQAHFSPGEIEGQQVKSLIRVEVVFDNTPIAPTAQPQAL